MKTQLIQLRLHPNEKAAFQQAAELAGVPLSAWVRERLRWAAIKELEQANKKILFIEEAQ